MLQDYAVKRGMDSHGKQFIQALDVLSKKMRAAECLYDQEDEVLDLQEKKETMAQAMTELRDQAAEAQHQYDDLLTTKTTTGRKLKRRRGLNPDAAPSRHAPAARASAASALSSTRGCWWTPPSWLPGCTNPTRSRRCS